MIDWTQIIVGIVTGGGLGSLFLLRENKMAKHISNDTAAADNWQELFAKSEERVEKLSHKVDQLYDDITKFRDENNRLSTENAVLKLQKCEKNGCSDRVPPRSW